jgi:hypothetical protein
MHAHETFLTRIDFSRRSISIQMMNGYLYCMALHKRWVGFLYRSAEYFKPQRFVIGRMGYMCITCVTHFGHNSFLFNYWYWLRDDETGNFCITLYVTVSSASFLNKCQSRYLNIYMAYHQVLPTYIWLLILNVSGEK